MASISDNFDRTDNTDLGANWTEDAGAWEISGNNLNQTTGVAAYYKCRWVGSALASDDYDVEVDGQSSGASVSFGAFGRGAVSATVTYYALQGFGADAFYIVEITAGSEAILASGGTCNASTTYNVRLNCNGDSLTGFVNDVSTVGPWTDPDLSTGAVGAMAYSLLNNTNEFIDNFAAADLATESASVSPSVSPSTSVSPSPSPGYTGYSRGNYAALPSDDADLETTYSAQDVTDVSSANDTRVNQAASGEFAVHQYKNFVGNKTSATLSWEGQTDFAPGSSTVFLQIYNRVSPGWDTVDSDSTSGANTDFPLTADVNLANYKDGSSVISCRIYQQAV